jgi:hypothetical protein
MIESRLSKKLPNLGKLDLFNDYVIEKYIHSNKKKIEKNQVMRNDISDES